MTGGDGVMGGDGARQRPLTTVVLRRQQDEDGLRRLEATRRPDGGIVIEGQDLGPGVEQIYGPGLSEYEWVWVVGPDAVAAVVAAFDGLEGDDPLPLLVAWMAAHGGLDPGSRLREAGVPIEFWNRIGD